jgi:hypothetical protein
MTDRALIVARTTVASLPSIAEAFARSDESELPHLLGVRRRSLFSYRDLYFHFVEFEGDRRAAMSLAASRPDFTELSRQLRPFVEPYDPESWRSPADAMSVEFYSWTPDSGAEFGGAR